MHFTKYLILLVALCGMAQAQIIKSNVFVRTDVTNETDKATARALLGMFEWVTNSVPSYTGNHSSEAALDVDDVLGDAGLRLKYGANEYMLKMNGTNLLLVSAADGSTPVYVASPPEATILTYKSLTNLFVLKTLETKRRSAVTTSTASFAGEMLSAEASACSPSGWVYSDFTNFTTNGTTIAYTNAATAVTNTMQASLRSTLAANHVYDVTITLSDACVITNSATISVALGGNVIGQIKTTTSSFRTTARCGNSTNLVLTLAAPTAGEIRIEFATISIVPWATADLVHSHTYTAGTLVHSASDAPYFELTASGSNAANGNAKNKIVALAGSSVTSSLTATPVAIFTATTSDNAGDWVLRGKVYATGAGTAAAEFFYSDPAGTVVDSYPITTVTGWTWTSSGYIYIGANADTADSDVTVRTSSVEFKP